MDNGLLDEVLNKKSGNGNTGNNKNGGNKNGGNNGNNGNGNKQRYNYSNKTEAIAIIILNLSYS